MLSLPEQRRYEVHRNVSEAGLDGLCKKFASAGYHRLRDIVIGPPGDAASDLIAEAGDFWFHTDGAFLPTPPRWVGIYIIEAEAGGALQLLSSEHLRSVVPSDRFRFGNENHYFESQIVTTRERGSVFRYRRDYMTSDPEGQHALSIFDAYVAQVASQHAVRIGMLQPTDFLVFDNWGLLHRREAFQGRRVIRRLWWSS